MRTAVVALFLLASCRWHGMDHPPLGGRGGGGVTQGASSAHDAAMARKKVTGKEAPGTIVAFDGSKCVVTEARFKEITIGEQLWCVWIASQ